MPSFNHSLTLCGPSRTAQPSFVAFWSARMRIYYSRGVKARRWTGRVSEAWTAWMRLNGVRWLVDLVVAAGENSAHRWHISGAVNHHTVSQHCGREWWDYKFVSPQKPHLTSGIVYMYVYEVREFELIGFCGGPERKRSVKNSTSVTVSCGRTEIIVMS